MAVIWGLDLREMQWGKFKNSYMWNKDYHLRRTKFIVYQCAMIFCVVSESLGTAALSDYVDQQDYIAAHSFPHARVHNNNFIGIASYNIFVGVYVATIFGSALFFDLFWPERHESPSVKLAWRICSVLACAFTLSAALGFTIILATKSAFVTGTDAATAERLLAEYGGSPMRYRDNGRGIASVVFLWPGMIATFASTALLWHCLNHIDMYGPKSTHARLRDDPGHGGLEKPVGSTASASRSGSMVNAPPDGAESPGAVSPPPAAHTHDRMEGQNQGYTDAATAANRAYGGV